MTDWHSRYKCSTCAFELWLPIARLRVSSLGLNNDARFPGRCLLVLHEHQEDFGEIEEELASAFVADARLASQAIKAAVKVPRINYALLGNREKNIHFHLIPRGHQSDPIPQQAPWEHPERQTKLSEHEISKVINKIRTELELIVPCRL